MLGRRTKAISEDADYAVDLNRFRVSMNKDGDVDCFLDSELSNSKRKRVGSFSSRENIMNNGAILDEYYVAFLLDLEEFAEVGFVEEDVDDPGYVMFLDNLKEWGNSYVLDKSIENGIPLPIMYEVEIIHSNKAIKRKRPRFGCDEYVQKERSFVEKINRRNVRSRGVNGAQKTRTRGESMKRKESCSRSDCYVQEVRTLDSSEDTISVLKNSGFCNRMVKPLNEVVQEKRTVGEVIKRRKLTSHTGNDIQEERNLNVNDHPKFGTESSSSRKNTAKPVSYDYLREEQRTKKKNPICLSSDYLQEQFSGVIGDSRSAPKSLSLQKTVIDEVYNLFMKNFKVIGESCVYEYGDNKRVYYYLPSDSRLAIEAGSSKQPIAVAAASSDHIPSDRRLAIKADSSKHPIIVAAESSNHLPSDWRVAIEADSSKQPITVTAASSDHLPSDWRLAIEADSRMQPITVAAESSDQPKREIVFGLRSKASARNHRVPPLHLTVRVAPQRQPTQPSPSSVLAPRSTIPPLDKQLDNNLKICHRVPSNMRKKLLVILSQPYSKQEHEQLWKEVSLRSAVLIHRDSRSGGSDRPGHMGRSLLDWNPDLRSEIEKVKSDPHKVLNLLRMLSFYIKKLPCGKICKPWMDDSLMAILPGSS